jgi:hypothetical protein
MSGAPRGTGWRLAIPSGPLRTHRVGLSFSGEVKGSIGFPSSDALENEATRLRHGETFGVSGLALLDNRYWPWFTESVLWDEQAGRKWEETSCADDYLLHQSVF